MAIHGFNLNKTMAISGAVRSENGALADLPKVVHEIQQVNVVRKTRAQQAKE
jgi:hypothetical protein